LPQVDQHGCVNGNCTIVSCNGGWDDCDGGPGNGCEINIDNDPLNCNQCFFVCDLPNVLLHGCSGGNCTILSCDPGWGDCTGGAGCETDTDSDENYCGDCSTSCGGSETCCEGNCANLQTSEAYCGNCTTSCAGNETCCAGNGVDTQTDENYCGNCVTSCPGNETCCSGGCTFTQTDPFNCGDCGTICEQNHVVVNSCSGGNCTPICQADWDDCDANPNNGCETPLNADDSCGTNCGDIVDCTGSGLSCCGGGVCC
jgi:hypothetical protein